MTVVVDTNVVAYLLLGPEPQYAEAREFWRRAPVCFAPSSWEAEWVNVVWMAVRAGVLDAEAGPEKLALAESLAIRSEPVHELWEGALTRAVRSDHPAYDTLFVELAVRLAVPLVTFDDALRRRFPDVARRPADLTT